MKNPGIGGPEFDPEFRQMATRAVDRSLPPQALAEIERSLRGKLKAYSLSDLFIERYAEDALQKGLVDYLGKIQRGEAVSNRNGFVVQAAFRRAIDDARRESRHADGAVVEALIDAGGVSQPSTDEVAIKFLEAEALRDAVGRLSPEEQQVLSLYYFHELSAEAGAEKLYCSERTYLRRLNRTLQKLRRLLDGPVPQPGSDLAIEVGVVAWVALKGATVVLAFGPFEQLLAPARDLTTRIFASDAPEKTGAIFGGPAGKVAGGCLSLVAACALTGVVGPGVGGVDLLGQSPKLAARPAVSSPQGVEREADRAAPVAARPQRTQSAPQPGPASVRPPSTGESAAEKARAVRRAERHEVKQRTHGITRAGTDAPTPVESSVPTEVEVESSSPPEAEATATAGSEAAQAKQEFGAFK